MLPVITEYPDNRPGTVWRFRQLDDLPFDPVVFNAEQLKSGGLITGAASAGRGNTCFFTHRGQSLVLRHYHRGGLVQHLSKDRYLFTGLEETRSMREFGMLLALHQQHFPVSVPYACQVVRSGMCYRASLVTYKLDAQTLAERLGKGARCALAESVWGEIGRTLARMHALGVYHADLNAHNIMLNERNAVSVIDFDRARQRVLPAGNPASGWCLSNIDRLERSIDKLCGNSSAHAQDFVALKRQWMQTLCAS